MIRKIVNAAPLVAAALVGVALNSTPAFTKAPHHTQVKIAAFVAVAWLVLQIGAAALTRQRQSPQRPRYGPPRRSDRGQQPSGYSYPWQ